MTVVAIALVLTGSALVLACTTAAALVRSPYTRLHCITPITSLAVPLIGAGLSVFNGWSMTTGSIVIVVLLQAVTGPALTAAMGRVLAQHDGIVPGGSPE